MNLICEAKFEDEQNRSIGSKVMDKNVSLIPNLSGCPRYFLANISRNMADKEKLSMGIIIGAEKSMLLSKTSKFGSVVPEIWAKKWSKWKFKSILLRTGLQNCPVGELSCYRRRFRRIRIGYRACIGCRACIGYRLYTLSYGSLWLC